MKMKKYLLVASPLGGATTLWHGATLAQAAIESRTLASAGEKNEEKKGEKIEIDELPKAVVDGVGLNG